MDEEGDRQLGGHARRPQRPAPHRIVVGAGEAELVEDHRVHLGEQVAVDAGQLGRLAALVEPVEVVGRHDAVHGRDRAAAGERVDVAVMAVAGQARDLAGRGVDPEHRLLERVLGGDQQALAVLRPFDRTDRTVPRLGQRPHRAAGEVAQHQHLAIGFVSRPRHGEISERSAVGRDRRKIVGRVVGVGQIGRRRAAVAGRREDVEVGRQSLGPPGFAQREIERPAVGREVQSPRRRRTAWMACRRPDCRSAETPAAGEPAAGDREPEQARADARRRPRVPVADEQLVVDAARCRSRAWAADRRN